ncbi:uncharacterized protein CTRU02_206193 [Colletotrichum truncatum]|uniref:Uncharacterized protein n=1 Tax=Colletotrichum truncatum TaxID=5467 RepID=A0ACC3Z650_COLTU
MRERTNCRIFSHLRYLSANPGFKQCVKLCEKRN